MMLLRWIGAQTRHNLSSMQQSLEMARIFKSLSDPMRIDIIRALCSHPEGMHVGKLGEVLAASGRPVSSLSFHIKELRLTGLLQAEKSGRHILCRLNCELLESVKIRLTDILGGEWPLGEKPE